MDIEGIKKYLQKEETGEEEEDEHTKLDQLSFKFFDPFIISAIRVDLIEPDRVLCSFKIPPRLVDAPSNTLHGGAIAALIDLVGSTVVAAAGIRSTGVSVEINFSCVDHALANEEIEIEAKKVRVGKAIAVVNVELRKKATGKIIAQGRHTKYLPVKSNM